MQFAINDKVIHPRHGVGRITGIEQKDLSDSPGSYYVIYIPAQRLTVRVPSDRMERAGVRLAISLAKLSQVLDILRSTPGCLHDIFAERQRDLWTKLETGLVLQAAEVVRDLSWRRRDTRLTKKDSEYLSRGREWLAAEMALASDGQITEANHVIDAALAAGMECAIMQEELAK
jgi:CarD family transcriptional regulator